MNRPAIPTPSAIVPAVSWRNPGAKLMGALAGYSERQATEFGTGKPAFFSNGDPKLEEVLTLVTVAANAAAVDSGDGPFQPFDMARVYIQSGGDRKAWRTAQLEYAAADHPDGIDFGALICVHYVGEERGDGFTRKVKEFQVKDPGDGHAEFVAEAKAFAAREDERARRRGGLERSEPFETVNTTDPTAEGYEEPF